MPSIETRHPEPDGQEQPSISADLRANRYDVLSRLADDLAHEIKNPLNAMVVNLELVRRWIANGKVAPALERAGVIEHEIRRVHLLVDQMLQLLRPGRSPQGPQAVDAIVESLCAAVQVQAKAARVPFEVQTENSLYAEFAVEPFKFALLNLLTDAIDAEAAAGGAVALHARRAGREIYIELKCTRALLGRDVGRMPFVDLLMAAAGGTLESVEPAAGAGSCATLALRQAKFGMNETTGNQL